MRARLPRKGQTVWSLLWSSQHLRVEYILLLSCFFL